MTEAFCGNCGAARLAGAKFCPNCGQAYEGSAAPTPPPVAAAGPSTGPTAGGAVKQGFGWSAGCLLFIVAVVVGLAVLGGLGRSSTTGRGPGTPIATNPPGLVRAPHTLTGSGISKTAPFDLQGDYTVTWQATPDSQYGCYMGASLERADGQFIDELLVNEILNSSAPKSGSTRLYGLDAARYYVDANSGCKWSFTFTPA